MGASGPAGKTRPLPAAASRPVVSSPIPARFKRLARHVPADSKQGQRLPDGLRSAEVNGNLYRAPEPGAGPNGPGDDGPDLRPQPGAPGYGGHDDHQDASEADQSCPRLRGWLIPTGCRRPRTIPNARW